jgi:glycosyltransferase involved in cell wall biosynthesis
MKVTVVTVTLNAAAWLAEALQSIADQTHPDIELVIVDGVSTDATLDIVSSFSALNPKVLSGRDQGIYDAMNKGREAATGDAIFFLNADDRFAQPDALAHLVQALSASCQADLAFGDVLVVSGEGDQYRSHQNVSVARLGFETLCHQAVLARRTAFDRVGGFDLRYRISADLEWLVRCGQAGLVFLHVPRLVCRYTAGGESDRQSVLRRADNREILLRHRSATQRAGQRVAAAWRRRLARLSNAVA